jgi:translation initiation factor eIF-2B subunit gamma
MPAPGFQAVILCGPGVSFDTFTSKPEESPKALIPIANRPMAWYPLDFCYRIGITSTLLNTLLSSLHTYNILLATLRTSSFTFMKAETAPIEKA